MADYPYTPPAADHAHEVLSDLLVNVQQVSALRVYRFPSALERDFLRKRVADSQSIIKVGRAYLVVIILGLFLKNLLMHPDLLAEHHFRLIWLTYLPLTLAVGGIISGHRLEAARRHLYACMICFGALAVWSVSLSAVLVRQPDYSGMAAIYVAITIALVTFGLRLLTAHFLLMMSLTGLLVIQTAHWLGSSVPVLPFLHYYVLVTAVMFGLSAISEWRERTAFLQEMLLDIQTRRLQDANARLSRLARHDPLTGLYNRRAFDSSLEREWERALRDTRPLSVLFLDVDYFKLYNDSLGHGQGDVCLKRVAQALERSLLRATDVVARYGGEEFVILLPGTDSGGAEEIARRVMAGVRELDIPHPRSPVSGQVTLSIGIASVIPQGRDTPAQLVRQADQALYEAKEQGRNRHIIARAPVRMPEAVPLAG